MWTMDDFDVTSPVKRQPLVEVSNIQEPQNQLCQQSAGQPTVVDEWTPSYNRDTITADRMTYKKLLTTVLSSRRQTIDFLMDAGIIDRRKSCTTCGADMNLVMSTSSKASSEGWEWCCRRTIQARRHQVYASVKKDSWLACANLNLSELMELIYFWSAGLKQTQIQHECGFAWHTTVDWFSFCREICEAYMMKVSEPIGGPGIECEIDESKFGKRKYHRGHRVEGDWVFGGREKFDKSKIFMFVVKNRTRDELLPLIKKWIKPGSIIHSDCWKPYDTLGQEGYTHLKVNHSIQFTNPETGANTNHIENEWRHAKQAQPSYGTVHAHVQSYLAQHLWRRKFSNQDHFKSFLNTVVQTFDHNTWNVPGQL